MPSMQLKPLSSCYVKLIKNKTIRRFSQLPAKHNTFTVLRCFSSSRQI
jgi:hypothetical protein